MVYHILVKRNKMKQHFLTKVESHDLSPFLLYVNEKGKDVDLDEREVLRVGGESIQIYHRCFSKRTYFAHRDRWFSVPPGKCVKSAVLKLQAYDRASIPTWGPFRGVVESSQKREFIDPPPVFLKHHLFFELFFYLVAN